MVLKSQDIDPTTCLLFLRKGCIDLGNVCLGFKMSKDQSKQFVISFFESDALISLKAIRLLYHLLQACADVPDPDFNGSKIPISSRSRKS